MHNKTNTKTREFVFVLTHWSLWRQLEYRHCNSIPLNSWHMIRIYLLTLSNISRRQKQSWSILATPMPLAQSWQVSESNRHHNENKITTFCPYAQPYLIIGAVCKRKICLWKYCKGERDMRPRMEKLHNPWWCVIRHLQSVLLIRLTFQLSSVAILQ